MECVAIKHWSPEAISTFKDISNKKSSVLHFKVLRRAKGRDFGELRFSKGVVKYLMQNILEQYGVAIIPPEWNCKYQFSFERFFLLNFNSAVC